jgi:hypothetical protein
MSVNELLSFAPASLTDLRVEEASTNAHAAGIVQPAKASSAAG